MSLTIENLFMILVTALISWVFKQQHSYNKKVDDLSERMARVESAITIIAHMNETLQQVKIDVEVIKSHMNRNH